MVQGAPLLLRLLQTLLLSPGFCSRSRVQLVAVVPRHSPAPHFPGFPGGLAVPTQCRGWEPCCPCSQHTAVVLQHGDLLALSPGAGHPPAWQRASALLLQRTLWFSFILKESSACTGAGQLHDGHQSTRNERGGRFMAGGTRCPQHHCLCPSPVQLPLRSHILAAGVRAPGRTRGPAAVGWERPPRNANQSSR